MTPLILDSDTLVWWGRQHPADVFTNMWTLLDQAVANGVVRIPEAVSEDLSNGTDAWPEWIEARPDFVVPFDENFEPKLQLVVDRFPTLALPGSENNRSDPHVVAAVLSLDGIGVTREAPRRAVSTRIKVPDAIRGFGKTSLDWFQFLRHCRDEFGWQL